MARSRNRDLEEALAILDVHRVGLVPLSHAVGVLASLPGCPAWPDTAAVHKALRPHAVAADAAQAALRGRGADEGYAARHGPLVDYRGFLRRHGPVQPGLSRLAEQRERGGVYDGLGLHAPA